MKWWQKVIVIANAPLRRAARTFLQAFLSVVTFTMVTPFILASVTGEPVDWNVLRKLLASGVIAGGAAVWAWVQNAIEDKTGKSLIIEKHADPVK